MCGIFAFVAATSKSNDHVENANSIMFDDSSSGDSWLARRGPDAIETVVTENVHLRASVLHMRDRLVPQPVHVIDGIHFAWNGEVYDDDLWETSVVDTEFIAQELRHALEPNDATDATSKKFHAVLSKLTNAEFTCCLVTPTAIMYARDSWGRRSLLVAKNVWCIASTAFDSSLDWEEVQPGALHVYNVSTQRTDSIPFAKLARNIEPSWVCGGIVEASVQLEAVLQESVRRRCLVDNTAVLFSGGLDSVVVAALALKVLPSITLVTVSFIDGVKGSDAADALAAEASHCELEALFPTKRIEFIHRVVDWKQVQENETRIRQLIHPKTTLMDLNISVALWFAAGAAGHNTRALLSGLGADELMGGYSRHRRAWTSGGPSSLATELELDQSRLWDRNLGRDDRVLSDTSHEVRFPFLDPTVVDFIQQQPVDNVVDFSMDNGGDKRILRLVAERMGLQAASQQPKRAIQFGSRVAHVSDTRRFGSRRKATGTAVARKAPSSDS